MDTAWGERIPITYGTIHSISVGCNTVCLLAPRVEGSRNSTQVEYNAVWMLDSRLSSVNYIFAPAPIHRSIPLYVVLDGRRLVRRSLNIAPRQAGQAGQAGQG
jgi:hypothetical protein